MKKNIYLRLIVSILRLMFSNFKWGHFLQFKWFFKDLLFFKNTINDNFYEIKMYPCLSDKTIFTPLDPVYFYQDTWAAKKIFEIKPSRHCDIGSSAKTVGILSQFVPTTMVDIRPIPLKINGLTFIKGSILNLPFENNSLESVSSLCVIEHIGLGRYGDELDVYGSEKAILELKRVVRLGGVIIFSVPVDRVNTVYFNAHRAFTREYILSMFSDFQLIEEKYQYGEQLLDKYNPIQGFGTGLFLFKKIGS